MSYPLSEGLTISPAYLNVSVDRRLTKSVYALSQLDDKNSEEETERLEAVEALLKTGKCKVEKCSICTGVKDETCIFCEQGDHHAC